MMLCEVTSGEIHKQVLATNHREAAEKVLQDWGDDCSYHRMGETILVTDNAEGVHFGTVSMLTELNIPHKCFGQRVTCEKCDGACFGLAVP
jgi:hypothetical protein